MAKHVCSCHGTRCFQKKAAEGRAQGEKGKRGEKKKPPLKESGGHMSPLLLSVLVLHDLMLNVDAEEGNKVEQGLNGGKKMSVSRTPSCSSCSKDKDNKLDLQSSTLS